MPLDKDLLELLELFRSNGVEFLVVGGHAVAFYLIRNKRATGRTQDLADAERLERLQS